MRDSRSSKLLGRQVGLPRAQQSETRISCLISKKLSSALIQAASQVNNGADKNNPISQSDHVSA
jgi:hypothetical protein